MDVFLLPSLFCHVVLQMLLKKTVILNHRIDFNKGENSSFIFLIAFSFLLECDFPRSDDQEEEDSFCSFLFCHFVVVVLISYQEKVSVVESKFFSLSPGAATTK